MSQAPSKPVNFANILPGDPAPWFHQRTTRSPRYAFDTVGGRYVVLCFLVSAQDAAGKAALAAVKTNRFMFDDERASFFGVTLDPRDEQEPAVVESVPGIRFFYDFDAQVSRLYGAAPIDATTAAKGMPIRRMWFVLDPTLRVLKVFPFQPDGSDGLAVMAYLGSLPPPKRHAGVEMQAPVLLLPNVFEPEFCQKLIGLYEEHGGAESGFMREVDGRTVLMHDHAHKRRRDYQIEDEAIVKTIQGRFNRRVKPELLKAYQFTVSRMERYLVACYAAEDEAHFRAHRDNTTKGTAHRRFAVSINLNDAFDGGEVSFPEFGPRSFKPPPGGAVVFSCSLLHAVSKVTRGRRFAFLPFLYDEAAAAIREKNLGFLDMPQAVPA